MNIVVCDKLFTHAVVGRLIFDRRLQPQVGFLGSANSIWTNNGQIGQVRETLIETIMFLNCLHLFIYCSAFFFVAAPGDHKPN